jgi:hypothetical protein
MTVDWPVAGSNVFMAIAVFALLAAPLVGNHGGWRRLPGPVALGALLLLVVSFSLLAFSWRGIAGGMTAALFGHIALIVSVLAMAQAGQLIRVFVTDRLTGALLALVASALLVVGVFAAGPLAGRLSTSATAAVLLANPLVAITSAAGIDLLHLEVIYRTSPLAHRGVALPAWTTASAVYAVTGLAAFGVSRIRPRSHQS